ncbi:hypothetical protein OKW30_003506 [Paraburkholderia sp. Clong3]
MAATERITMTKREVDRFRVIQDVADGRLKPGRAAERLRLTTRQIRRLVGRLRDQGAPGLVSRRRAKAVSPDIKSLLIEGAGQMALLSAMWSLPQVGRQGAACRFFITRQAAPFLAGVTLDKICYQE